MSFSCLVHSNYTSSRAYLNEVNRVEVEKDIMLLILGDAKKP